MQANTEKPSPLEAACGFTPRAAARDGGMRVPPWLTSGTLNRLVEALDVQVIALSGCLVGPGFSLDLHACDTPSFHYIREGRGRLYVPDEMPVEIGPQTLVVVPPHCPFRFELTSAGAAQAPGQGGAAAFMLCGIFRALYGDSVDLFDTLHAPIVEQFASDDAPERKLQLALTELVARNICSEVVVSGAMKQVIVALIRRSLLSLNGWTRRFGHLSA